jgi:hypothetical protein
MVLASCGAEDEPTPEEEVQGVWFVETPDRFNCLVGLVLEADGVYEQDLVCSLEGGGYGIQVEIGSWSLIGKRIRFLPERSSCANGGTVLSRYASYDKVSDDVLRLVWPDGVVVFDRAGDGDGMAGLAAAFGCFDVDRVFTPAPITTL